MTKTKTSARMMAMYTSGASSFSCILHSTISYTTFLSKAQPIPCAAHAPALVLRVSQARLSDVRSAFYQLLRQSPFKPDVTVATHQVSLVLLWTTLLSVVTQDYLACSAVRWHLAPVSAWQSQLYLPEHCLACPFSKQPPALDFVV
jgi:hypothetical protein